MNGSELLRVVDAIHRDKNIEKEIVFDGIEQAILSAARKHFGEESEIVVDIDRDSGEPSVKVDDENLAVDEIGDLLGRIAAQTAKQVMIQKIREAERDSLFDEFGAMKGQIVTGSVTRVEGGAVTVSLGRVEGILPRGEQIPGEGHRVGERLRSVVIDVRKVGSRVRIYLSRTHAELVRRLFEIEIPEVSEHVIEVRSLAREAGYRSKVAVSSIDSRVDCVGACVGVRGSRIKSIVDELAGERIDIVRWNDSLQVLVPNALQPAEAENVILCPMLGKIIVLVRDDQLSLAIGKKGQNVRLASKLVGWDIHVMTLERLNEQLEGSVEAFSAVSDINEELAENLVAQGFFSFEDLSVIEPDQLAELGGLTTEQCDTIIAFADVESVRVEAEERLARAEARTRQQEASKAAAAEAEAAAASESSEQQEESDPNAETVLMPSSESAESESEDAKVEDAEAQTSDESGEAETVKTTETTETTESGESGETEDEETEENSASPAGETDVVQDEQNVAREAEAAAGDVGNAPDDPTLHAASADETGIPQPPQQDVQPVQEIQTDDGAQPGEGSDGPLSPAEASARDE